MSRYVDDYKGERWASMDDGRLRTVIRQITGEECATLEDKRLANLMQAAVQLVRPNGPAGGVEHFFVAVDGAWESSDVWRSAMYAYGNRFDPDNDWTP